MVWLPKPFAEAAEYAALIRSGEDGEDPQDLVIPAVEDAETPRIGLQGLSGKRGNGFDLSRKRPVSEPNQVVGQAGAFLGGQTIEITLGSPDEPQVFRDFACHADTLST